MSEPAEKGRGILEAVRAAVLEVGLFEAPGRRVFGPCDLDAERFLIACVLHGDAKRELLRLAPGEFWSVFHQRLWHVMLTVSDPTDLQAIEKEALRSGNILGPIVEELERIKLHSGEEWVRSMRDIETAAQLVMSLARDRSLARLLASTHDDLIGKRIAADDARKLLADWFKSNK
jgi:hypothetical protein